MARNRGCFKRDRLRPPCDGFGQRIWCAPRKAEPTIRDERRPTSPSFQELILRLHGFWAAQGCVILQPYDVEMGAGTFHPATTLRALGPRPWRAAYVQPSRRPSDGRYGENPNRLQHYYQYQVIMKPSPADAQELLLASYRDIGLDPLLHDFRFVEDDWESPTLGAWGLGWEVWCDGMEVGQFTYFQQVGGIAGRAAQLRDDLRAGAAGDVRAGRGERVRPRFQRRGRQLRRRVPARRAGVQRLQFRASPTRRCCRGTSPTPSRNARPLLERRLALPAYDQCIKASHLFNLLDARGVISVTERASYIGRVRALAKGCCEAWVAGEA